MEDKIEKSVVIMETTMFMMTKIYTHDDGWECVWNIPVGVCTFIAFGIWRCLDRLAFVLLDSSMIPIAARGRIKARRQLCP